MGSEYVTQAALTNLPMGLPSPSGGAVSKYDKPVFVHFYWILTLALQGAGKY